MKNKKTKIEEIKEWYQIVAWLFIKNNRVVPKHINDILDLIEYLEDIEKLKSENKNEN